MMHSLPAPGQPARYCAAWLLPVTSPPVEDGAVLVVDGRIAAVGPRSAVPLPDDAVDIDLGHAAILPGLVNVHAHPDLAVLRGALEDLPFHTWIFELRRMKAAVQYATADWRDAARWSCAEAAAAGITTLAATEDSDATLHALRDAGMRGIAYREVFAPDPGAAATALAGLQHHVTAMRVLENDLVRVGVSPHAPYSVSDALFTAVAGYARDEDLPIAVHTAESEAEQQLVTHGDGFFASSLRARGIEVAARGTSTVDILQRTGILELAPLLIHCVRVTPLDITRMADAGARVAHCPVANARLGHGIAPVMELLDAGITVGLGSDSVASNNRMDILEEARVAQLMQRAVLLAQSALPAQTLLRLATIDGARALGLDHRVGSLEVGKDADICVVDFDAVHSNPVFEPLGTLFMSAQGTDVTMTMVRGRVIYSHGTHRTQDINALRARIDGLGEMVRATARERSVTRG